MKKKQKIKLKYRNPEFVPATGPRSTPADPNSRQTLKKQYNRFWKQRIFNADGATQLDYWVKFFDMKKNSAMMVLEKIPVKLWLENKITEEQKDNILRMLKSPDGKNGVVAISLMMQLGGRRMCGKKKQGQSTC